MNTHVDDLIAYPQRHFRRPDEVLAEPTLTLDQKRRILESWKLDAQRLAESTAENMTGGEETDLRDVSKVLVQLKSMETVPEARQSTHKGSLGVGVGMAAGALVGAGAGVVISAITASSLIVVAQASAVGLILGGVATAVRKAVRKQEQA